MACGDANRPSERDPPASGRVLVDEAEVEWLVEGARLTVHPAECLWAAWFLWRSNRSGEAECGALGGGYRRRSVERGV